MECITPHSDEDYRPRKPRIRPPRISRQVPKPMAEATGLIGAAGVGVGSTGSGVVTLRTAT